MLHNILLLNKRIIGPAVFAFNMFVVLFYINTNFCNISIRNQWQHCLVICCCFCSVCCCFIISAFLYSSLIKSITFLAFFFFFTHYSCLSSVAACSVNRKNHKIDIAILVYRHFNVEELQCNVKPFDIQHSTVRNTVTLSVTSAKCKLSFNLQYHERSVSIKTGVNMG